MGLVKQNTGVVEAIVFVVLRLATGIVVVVLGIVEVKANWQVI